MKVDVKFESDTVPLPLTNCMECKRKWGEAKIMEQLRLINWGMVEAGADLTVIVSYIIVSPNHCG